MLDALVVIEELAKECRPAAFQVFEANTGPARVLSLLGLGGAAAAVPTRGDHRRDHDRTGDLRAGRRLAATDLATRAKYADGSYTINGGKRWTSNGSEADAYLVYARLSDEPGAKGIGALIVEADRPG